MIKVLELFAGIGACSKALTNLGIEHEIVDAVEIDKYAIKSFNAIHGTNFEPQDITKWNKDVQVDLIMHGSPCQDFSAAGKGAGGDEGSGTRSSLMYETLRIVEKLRPKYVIWENVKNLLSKKHKSNFDAYRYKMNVLGYNNYSCVLNAKNYGIPQNRERVFTVSILGDKEFWFPKPAALTHNLKDYLENNVEEKYFLSDDKASKLIRSLEDDTFIIDDSYKRSRPPRFYKEYSPTIRAKNTDLKLYIKNNKRIRKLTPRECWRLMGFSDEDFNKASKVNSNSQLYKQAGNSIVVNVLEGILKNLI